MKPAIVFVIAFVASTAAGAGAKVAMTHPEPPKTAADSTKTEGDSAKQEGGDEAGAKPAGTEAEHAAAPTESAKPTESAAAPKPAAAEPVAVAPSAAAPTTAVPTKIGIKPPSVATIPAVVAATEKDTVARAAEQRVAKVFTAMDPKQAAKVLEHMTDNDIEIILGYVGPRQAAAIMSALPAERVATLSKLAMQKSAPKAGTK